MSQFDLPPGAVNPAWATRPDLQPQQPSPIPPPGDPRWDAIKRILSNPGSQSEELLKLLQQHFLEKFNQQRPNSPLDPRNRPGIDPSVREELGGGMMRSQ